MSRYIVVHNKKQHSNINDACYALILFALLSIVALLLFLLLGGTWQQNTACTATSTTNVPTTNAPTSAPTGIPPPCQVNSVLRRMIDLKKNVNATADGRGKALAYNPVDDMLYFGSGDDGVLSAWISINPTTVEISQNYLTGSQQYGGATCVVDQITALAYYPPWETAPPAGGGVWVVMTKYGRFISMDLLSTTCVQIGLPPGDSTWRGFAVSDDELYTVEVGAGGGGAELHKVNVATSIPTITHTMTIPGFGPFGPGKGGYALAKSRISNYTYVIHHDAESAYFGVVGGQKDRQLGRIDLSTGVITRTPVHLPIPWGVAAMTFDNNGRLWYATSEHRGETEKTVHYLYSIEESNLNACFDS